MDWKTKLTSRKFWVSLANFIVNLVVFIQSPSGSAERITALVLATGGFVAYIVGEGLADAAGARSDVYISTDQTFEPLNDEEDE